MYNPTTHQSLCYSSYRENQFKTADKGKILLMMYDGAIRFINIAKDKIESKDRAAQGTYIGKAIAVINELNDSLDKKAGGDIAVSLERLYNYLVWELTNANLKNSAKNLGSCLNILTNLKEAWEDVVKKNSGYTG